MANFKLRAAFVLISLLLVTSALSPRLASAGPDVEGIPATYQQVAENDPFQLYVDSESLAFKVLDKRSGYVWHSGLDELIEGDRLNKSWQAFARSGISIEYLDEKALTKRISITNANHTLDIRPIDQGVSALVTFQDYGIAVEVLLQLEADGVRVEVPFASVLEDNPQFRLGLIYVYPFLGATRGGSTPGYMLLPDGTGSLIRFADSTKAQNMYYGRYYGNDLGMMGIQPYTARIMPPYSIGLPVFGMVHGEGQNAFLSVIEKGAAYGELQAHPAGILTNFNFLYTAFIRNQSYFQATNRSGAGVTVVQRQPNQFDIVVHYRFLTGRDADYVGMARSYQRYLVDKGLLHKREDVSPHIGIRLEFLGGDKEKVLFWHRFVPMTTIAQMRAILDNLKIPNPDVIYYGWQELGASRMPPTWLGLEGALGSLDDLRAIADEITAQGGSFSLYFDPQAAYWEEPGYSERNDLAMAITGISMEGYNRVYTYYFTRDVLQWRYANLAADVGRQTKTVGLALDSIGWTLYSDFRRGHQLGREAAIEAYQSLLAEYAVPLGIYRPNAYLFGLASAYYDMPLGDNSYIYTSESVPFVPVVLAGHMPYYGLALNFSSNLEDDLLRQVDYGIYPSYFLTYEPTANMLNTASSWIYSSSYDQWGDQVRNTYQWMNALLAPVRGQEITARTALAEGIYATTYANGKQIVVNYTDRPFVADGMTVEAKNAVLRELKPESKP